MLVEDAADSSITGKQFLLLNSPRHLKVCNNVFLSIDHGEIQLVHGETNHHEIEDEEMGQVL